MQEQFLGKEKVSLLERSPDFRVVLGERFHCTTCNDLPFIKSVMRRN